MGQVLSPLSASLFPLCKLEIVIVTHEELVSVEMTAGVRCEVLPGTGDKDGVSSCILEVRDWFPGKQ